MLDCLSQEKIRSWCSFHQKRLRYGDPVPSMSAIADKAGISRQTLYAIMNGERPEFGQIAQIRLSRVISQISSEPSYQHSKIARIDLSEPSPKIKFGV